MCKWSKWGDTRIDPCMKNLISFINSRSGKSKVVACCCGHGKYPMSIVTIRKDIAGIYEVVSGIRIPRKKRFYKRDKQGMYYIPEVKNA